MPDMNRTSNLISLMREDAVFVHWWILYQHPYPEIIKKLRRDLAHEIAADRPWSSVALDDVQTVQVLKWLGERGTLPDVVDMFRLKLADFVECEDIHEGGPR